MVFTFVMHLLKGGREVLMLVQQVRLADPPAGQGEVADYAKYLYYYTIIDTTVKH